MTVAEGLQPGFMVVHGNRMQDLRAVAVEWLRRYPLAPLEDEVILVQSNGIAQWLKLALARDADGPDGGCGIAAALSIQLPARFLWEAYRSVLGPDSVQAESPFAREPLSWRLMRLLPECLSDPAFAPLRRFLHDDHDLRKRWQLAGRLADLFDQYQVYRADWLADWAENRDQLNAARGQPLSLNAEQRWQPALWRAVLADLPEDERDSSRAAVHQRFMARIRTLDARPRGLPRRIVIFGISSLPAQMLEALEGLARVSQVLLCVHNPCEHYWADIVAERDLLRATRRRQAPRPGMPAVLADEDLHQHAHPLLAAWGKQGRDYIRLLDEHDDPQRYRTLLEALPWRRIDLFDAQDGDSLLHQLQDDIRDLRPLAETRALWPALDPARDRSVRFHQAHSPQREVEILHDELLDRFQRDPSLRPRDIIVMVPDVEAYAPHVQAVFGQIEAEDRRHIPFALSDQGTRGQDPLLIALERLLRLPESRFAVSDLLDLLDVPAVRRRFGIGAEQLPRLHAWVAGAGIRWGLDAAQRASLDLPEALEQNTWRFGLRRMLLGYAVAGPTTGHGGGPAVGMQPWAGIEPFDEIGGLDAALVGQLDRLLAALAAWWDRLRIPAEPATWGLRLRGLLEAFFDAREEAEQRVLSRLDEALEQWESACATATLVEMLPLTVVRESWLAAVDEPRLSQRFLGGAVTVCTLMPMRAIPFRVVCLLGLNDGEYPRVPTPMDFDLMARDYRPGDRSRRDDDRYLFLEALLSAGEQLYISWVGRSIRDNAPRPPSVLVSQLRDHLASGWRLVEAQADLQSGTAAQADTATGGSGNDRADEPDGERLLRALTVEHPLQPFSRDHFPADGQGPLFTFVREWAGMHEARIVPPAAVVPLAEPTSGAILSPEGLGAFLRNPVQAFFNQRLGVHFDEALAAADDQEPFVLDGLAQWQLRDRLIRAAVATPEDGASEATVAASLEAVLAGMRRAGQLPLAGLGAQLAEDLRASVTGLIASSRSLAAAYPLRPVPPPVLRFEHAGLVLEGAVAGLRANAEGAPAVLHHRAGRLQTGGQPAWRYDACCGVWVPHLLANARGLELSTFLVALDYTLHLAPLPAETAAQALSALLEGWRIGQSQPLPVACQSAGAWLEAVAAEREPEAAASQCYQGGRYRVGERDRSPYHARSYPTAALLLQGDGFGRWTEALYRPLYQAVTEAATQALDPAGTPTGDGKAARSGEKNREPTA